MEDGIECKWSDDGGGGEGGGEGGDGGGDCVGGLVILVYIFTIRGYHGEKFSHFLPFMM